LTPAASGRKRLRGLPQSVRPAFSPALAVVEQGGGLVDAPLASVGAIDSIELFGLVRLHAFYNVGMRQGFDAVQLPGHTGCDRIEWLRRTDPPPSAVAASLQRGSQITSGISLSVQRWKVP
jgi:hypothetical protein